MLKLRHEHDAPADHYQVYSGEVRIGTIYKTSGNPSGNEWFWGLNGVQNGPGPFNGFVPTLKDAKAAFSEAWRGRLEANNGFFCARLSGRFACATWPIASAGRQWPP